MAAKDEEDTYLGDVPSLVTRRIEDNRSSDPLARNIARYTEGDCWILALAIVEHDEDGYWQVAVTDTDQHAFAVSTDQKWALDIRGLCPVEQLLDKWDAEGLDVFRTAAAARQHFETEGWEIFSLRVLHKQAAEFANLLLSEARVALQVQAA